MKKEKNCIFCGEKTFNHFKLDNILNISWCTKNECHRKFHCILSTIIPNKEYEVKLIVKKRRGYVTDRNLHQAEVQK